MNKKQAILEAVADAEQISVAEIMSGLRYAPIAHALKIAFTALRFAGYSLEIIAQFMRRNHTTILSGFLSVSSSDKLYARRIVEDLGFPTYAPPKKNEGLPMHSLKPLPKLVVKPEPEKIKIQVLVPDYKNYVCKLVWREI